MTSILDVNIPSSSSSSEEDSDEDDIEGQKGRKHTCPFCEKIFRFPNKLREHAKIHEKDRYVCQYCPTLRFQQFNELRTHQKEVHSISNSYKCTECRYSGNKAAIRKHFQLNHVDGVACTIDGCSMKVAKNRLKTHIREEHKGFQAQTPSEGVRAKLTFEKCPRCDYRPDSGIDLDSKRDDLMSHVERVHEKKESSVECPLRCGTTVPVAELGEHLESCLAFPEEAPCTSSEGHSNTMTSSHVSLPSDHELEDETEPPNKMAKYTDIKADFECVVCRKVFRNRESLRKHSTRSHPEKPRKEYVRSKTFKCDREQCGKSFRTEQALQDHFNVHDDVKPYACATCNQRFHARDRFAVHLTKYHKISIKDINCNERDLGVSYSKTI